MTLRPMSLRRRVHVQLDPRAWPKRGLSPVNKVLASAVANAQNSDNLRSDDLFVSQAFVDEGMTMRRIRPRAKGSASRILKRSSHITVVVEPKEA